MEPPSTKRISSTHSFLIFGIIFFTPVISFNPNYGNDLDGGNLAAGTTGYGAIDYFDDQDDWTFYANSGDRITVDFSLDTAYFKNTYASMEVQLLDEYDGWINAAYIYDIYQDSPKSFQAEISYSGNYKIRVVSYSEDDIGGEYKVSWSLGQDTGGGNLAAGTTGYGSLDYYYDEDDWEIFGNDGDTITIDFDLDNSTYSGNYAGIEIQLHDDDYIDGRYIQDLTNDLPLNWQFQFPTSGDYTIRVVSYSDYINSYKVSWYVS
ncbi:MAG: hypothetical protein MK228_05255 [Nitrososphaerales archaeon]|nr:hypothetical protein [Nitrososphaerales archaeon]